MNKAARFVVYHPWLILSTTAVITAAALACLVVFGMQFNGSLETLARNDEALRFFDQVRKTFGDDRLIIVGIDTHDVFNSQVLRDIDRLTRRLESVNGVEQVHSLTNIQAIRNKQGDISIERLVPEALLREAASATDLQHLRDEVTADPLYVRQLVSADGRAAAINVFLKPLDEVQTRAAAEQIEAAARSEKLPYRLLFAGVPVIESRGVRNMVRDFGVLSPIAAVLCFIVFLLAYRTIWGAALPLVTLFVGLIWTLGLMSLLGKPITLTTLAIPTVLMAVGSSYFFHVLNQYRISMSRLDEQADMAEERAEWVAGLDFISPAIIVSGTATMAGFGSLATSSVPTVRDMGIFNTFGVFAMLLLGVAFIPASLSLLPARALGRVDLQKDYVVWMNKYLRRLTALIVFRPRTILAISLLLTATLGAGVMWLQINVDYLRIFPKRSETVRDAEEIHDRLAGIVSVQLVVSGRIEGADVNTPLVSTPHFLDHLTALEQYALSQPGVDSAISIADIVRRTNEAATGSPEGPASGRKEGQFDALKIITEDESVYRLVSRDLSTAVVVLRSSLSGSNQLRRLTNRLVEWSASNMPAGLSVRPTGSVVLLNDASDSLADSQVSSLATAILSIYLMMTILFRSFSTGLLALLPNLLPILSFFGFMGWCGITLDLTTSLIATGALGLAVDNAVHFIRRYRQSAAERSTDSPEREAWIMWLTMVRTGKPMALANLMLILAFLVFVLSSFAPVRTGGLLWALTIAACLSANLAFLPALMKTRLFATVAPGYGKAELKKGERRQEQVSG
jgi:predicted RND superfamily exporter protein